MENNFLTNKNYADYTHELPDINLFINKNSLTPEQYNEVMFFASKIKNKGLSIELNIDEYPLIITGSNKRLSPLAKHFFDRDFNNNKIRSLDIYND